MFDWDAAVEKVVTNKDYMPDPQSLTCPAAGGDVGNKVDDHHYVYLSHALKDAAAVEFYAKGYVKAHAQESPLSSPMEDMTFDGYDGALIQMREGVERFFITDITQPFQSAMAQAKIPLLIEWPGHHKDIANGGNVLFMDGHVEYMPYPGKWPMTKKTIGLLRELAELPSID